MSRAEACLQYYRYPDPLTVADFYKPEFKANCWCRDCVARHEEEHKIKDWLFDSLRPELLRFYDWCIAHTIQIDCNRSESIHCRSALSKIERTSYTEEWTRRIDAAVSSFGQQAEADAESEEKRCYEEIIDALKAKCFGQ